MHTFTNIHTHLLGYRPRQVHGRTCLTFRRHDLACCVRFLEVRLQHVLTIMMAMSCAQDLLKRRPGNQLLPIIILLLSCLSLSKILSHSYCWICEVTFRHSARTKHHYEELALFAKPPPSFEVHNFGKNDRWHFSLLLPLRYRAPPLGNKCRNYIYDILHILL